MLEDVNRRDAQAWAEHAEEMSRALKIELRTAPTGEAMRTLMAEQVTLIKSIPLDAAQRVHRLTLEGQENGTRAREISAEIQRSGDVAKSRADLIARTEVARSASTLTQARAQHVGSEGYIWRTADDGDVRHSHAQMNGKYVRWDSPPTLDKMTGHAGQFPNCRCYPEPVIPED
ncbi:phage head morphogenesis protein [Pandoraea sputorum]|uniref:phage head morphogenesis protein n=1 Tax=Pandoraea sputorum TaxID=93222 RepID=UPI001257DAA2|nr:phage minor head protein [Pandoraea sputorum]VVE79382.1 head morphogenesis protein [Pandoraea sputorum]